MPRLPIRASSLVLTACLAAAPAAGVQKQNWERLGGWRVSLVAPGTCAALRDFSGGTRLFLTSNPAGQGGLAISNRAWPMRHGQTHKITLVLDGERTVGTARGIQQDANYGVAVVVGPTFVRKLADGRELELLAEDGRSLAKLDLAGIATAVARMRGCVSEATGAVGYAPPAPPPPPPPSPGAGQSRRAQAAVPPSSFISYSDYPAAALAAREQGTVAFRLDISAEGRVTGCTITGSSGSAALDSATCGLMVRRGRFRPALNEAGKPVPDTFLSRMIWRLEGDPPPPVPPPPAQ